MQFESKDKKLFLKAFTFKKGIFLAVLAVLILWSVVSEEMTAFQTSTYTSPLPIAPVVSTMLGTQDSETPLVMGQSTESALIKKDLFPVTAVVDGDTFKVNISGKTETVRIVGVNTPETVDPRKSVECFGTQASQYLKTVLTGKHVSLESDQTQSDRDRYQRLLRFVFFEDGSDLGLTLIRDGYAHESLYSSKPHKYRSEYLLAQSEAQQNKKGLWADDACSKVISTSKTSVQTDARNCSGPDLDCSDFKTKSEAQNFFDGCGFNATNDPMNLDGSKQGDGIVCESLP